MRFRDRPDAGRRLAAKLHHLASERPVVLALPRGGVAVGLEIALALGAPLDLLLVRKIGAPGMEELAIGAIVEGERPEQAIDRRLVAELAVPPAYIEQAIARASAEIERRRKLYLGDRPPVPLAGRAAIVVDDGIATGSSMRAALLALRRRDAAKLVLAVPVAPPAAIEALRPEVDEICCLAAPEEFYAIGQFYADFHQLDDAEVLAALKRAPALR